MYTFCFGAIWTRTVFIGDLSSHVGFKVKLVCFSSSQIFKWQEYVFLSYLYIAVGWNTFFSSLFVPPKVLTPLTIDCTTSWLKVNISIRPWENISYKESVLKLTSNATQPPTMACQRNSFAKNGSEDAIL